MVVALLLHFFNARGAEPALYRITNIGGSGFYHFQEKTIFHFVTAIVSGGTHHTTILQVQIALAVAASLQMQKLAPSITQILNGFYWTMAGFLLL